ncbi:gliding motility-associated C-terminal domain-containing protein [Saccharicrinis carchari]|uniref:Gliding motility-associated C-terminal domain-containing protein n=1 Tax=Saccharicrinis carchari TaxID=1168039 RepID=A0A521CCK1_SACCC|nr:gliding motility-associated C-terminal domain-containing protein [Saccharicrinis carchari]SMO57156.1 gliding motility-associated C-terminal domain-containing protein [Saccharicrinis carchari]
MNTLFKYIFIFLLAASSQLSAQTVSIVSDNATASGNAAYPQKDTLFFYADIASATLSVAPISGSNVTYTWDKYENGGWTEVMTINVPDFPAVINEGAYRVTVNNNGVFVGQDVCWTFEPRILTLEVDTIFSDCTHIQLTTNTTTKPLNYLNPANGNPYTVNYELAYEWSSEPAGDANTYTEAQPTMEAPVEPITYAATAIAFNGAHSLEANFVYDDPKAVEANFTFNVTDRENKNELPINTKFTGITEYTGSSEILVFINDSSKGLNKSYTIDFNTNTEGGEEKPTENDLIEITFDKLGEYYMDVSVKNDLSGCTDLTPLGPIKIEEIYLGIPNVFTPDGDGINDEFMAVYSSIKEFKLIVFNRWGRKVFQTTDPGEAWDGKIGGKDAAEGVYFYVVTAKGYNKGEERKYEGPVHLLRGN